MHGPTPEPDGTCDDCVMIANGEHPDVYELDAASRTGVENVREEIIGRVQFAPTRGRYKIYIIDEVHMLSTAAFNALLKTLEEPPSHVVFILATTDPQKVPETIHSRCQRFDFRRISSESIVTRLGAICVAEDVEFEGEALDLIAHRAEGGMRNALTSLEQLIAFGEGKVTLEVAERMLGGVDTSDVAEIVRAVGTRDVAACFRWTADYVETGADLAQFVRDLAEHVRNMYVLTLAGADVALEVSDATRRELAHEMQWFGPDRLSRLLGVLGDLSAELKTSTNPRLSFEIALTRMVRPDSDLTLEALAERVETLEGGHSAVAHVVSAAAGQQAASPANMQAASFADARAVSPASAQAAAPASGQGSVGADVQQGGSPAAAQGAAPSLGAQENARAGQPERARVSGESPVAQVAAGSHTQEPSSAVGARGARPGGAGRARARRVRATLRRGKLRAVCRARRELAEPGGAPAHLAGNAVHAQEEQGCVRCAVPEHEGPLPGRQGPPRHRVPRRELVRLQSRAEARRAGRRPDGAHAGVRRGAAVPRTPRGPTVQGLPRPRFPSQRRRRPRPPPRRPWRRRPNPRSPGPPRRHPLRPRPRTRQPPRSRTPLRLLRPPGPPHRLRSRPRSPIRRPSMPTTSPRTRTRRSPTTITAPPRPRPPGRPAAARPLLPARPNQRPGRLPRPHPTPPRRPRRVRTCRRSPMRAPRLPWT